MSLFVGGSVFLGEEDVVRHGHLRMWAERGLIHVEDSRDNSYECVSVRTCLQRIKAHTDMLGKTSKREMYTEDQFDRQNRKRIQDMVDAMTVVCRRAQVQGMPTDASARRDKVRRRPKTVVVPTELPPL
jgi:hypothetical protein